MNVFRTTIGIHKRDVDVIYWVHEGAFDGFYVVIPGIELDILGYLPHATVVHLEHEAQRHYLEQTVNKNEREILGN